MEKSVVLKVVAAAALGLVCAAESAVAQPHFAVGVGVAPFVVTHPYPYYHSPFYYPYFGSPFFYGAYFQAPYPYPYGGHPYAGQSDLRIEMTPKEAAVYVDGYYAGVVEDFDGTFQRLHVEPGTHEIVVYLAGYRSRRERLYLSPNATRKLTGALEKLAPGEPNEPVPEPTGPPPDDPNGQGGRGTQGRGPEGPQERGPGRGGPPRGRADSGSLEIRTRPGGTEVLIDGETWTGGTDNDRLVVQLTPGRHHVEVRRDGYRTFSTEIEIKSGQTTPLNISLTSTN